MGSVVKAKVGELQKITREGRSRRIRKEVVWFIQSVVGKKNFLVIFKYGQKKDISYFLLVYLSSKGEVDMEEPISHLPKKNKANIGVGSVLKEKVGVLENITS